MNDKNILYIYTDGCSKGNPGKSAIGGCAYTNKRKPPTISDLKKYPEKFYFQFSKHIGEATNNQSEYSAVLYALQKIQNNNNNIKWDKIIFYLDSELAVKQINKIYKVKNSNIIELYQKVISVLSEIRQKINVQFIHVKREYNTISDFLANQAIKNQH